MKLRNTAILVVLTIVAVVVWVEYRQIYPGPVDRPILAARHMELLGEAYPADGGSRAFFFRLSHGHSLVLLVRHRDPRFGANPDYQEIWLCGNGGFRTYISLEHGSQLERKLLELLRDASCGKPPSEPKLTGAKPEMLAWIIDRIHDRKSTWDKGAVP